VEKEEILIDKEEDVEDGKPKTKQQRWTEPLGRLEMNTNQA